jgi:hypothetical protein
MKLVESDPSLQEICRAVEQRLRDVRYLDKTELPEKLLSNFESLPLKPNNPCAYDPKPPTVLINGLNFLTHAFDFQAAVLAHEIGHHAHDAGLLGSASHYETASRCIVADWLVCVRGLFDGLRHDRLEHYGKEYCEIFRLCKNEPEVFRRATWWYQVFLSRPRALEEP